MSHRHIGTRGWFAQIDRELRCRHLLGELCKFTYLKTQKEVSEVKTQGEWLATTYRGQVGFLRQGMGSADDAMTVRAIPDVLTPSLRNSLLPPDFCFSHCSFIPPRLGQFCCLASLESCRETSGAWCASSIFQRDNSHLTTGEHALLPRQTEPCLIHPDLEPQS